MSLYVFVKVIGEGSDNRFHWIFFFAEVQSNAMSDVNEFSFLS